MPRRSSARTPRPTTADANVVRKSAPRTVARQKVAAPRAAKRKPGGTKMKAYATFDLYLADRPPAQRRLITTLRRFVARIAPSLQESVKWGNGCWLHGKIPVAYVYTAEDHVQFGFLRGASLRDPNGLLQGNGQYVRHVKVRRPADIDEGVFAALLLQTFA